MVTSPKIKTKDLNERYLDVYFRVGSEHRKRLKKEYGFEEPNIDTSNSLEEVTDSLFFEQFREDEIRGFETYFDQEIGPLADKEFVALYGERNFARLERLSTGTRPVWSRFFIQNFSRPLRRILTRLGVKWHLRTNDPDLPHLPF